MILNLPIQTIAEQKIEYRILAQSNNITHNQNYFNVPIVISTSGQSFSPNDVLDITISNSNEINSSINIGNILFIDSNNFKATLIIPTTKAGEQLNLIFGIKLNDSPNVINSSLTIDLPKINTNNIQLSTSSIIGITVTVVVVIGLIGWIIYLVKKRSKEKVLDRYHNKRRKK